MRTLLMLDQADGVCVGGDRRVADAHRIKPRPGHVLVFPHRSNAQALAKVLRRAPGQRCDRDLVLEQALVRRADAPQRISVIVDGPGGRNVL